VLTDAEETPEAVEPPFDTALVADLLRQFDKTVRAHQMYPSHNAQYIRTMENLRTAFAAVWDETQAISLQVTDTELTWCDVNVLSEPEKVSDSLPWTLFKDGVREITLTRGFEGEELERFLKIIPLVRRAQDHEDDILTLLWEQEFVFLSYRFIDSVSGQGAPLDPSATPGRWPAQAARPNAADTKEAVAEAKKRRVQGFGSGGGADESGLDRALAASARGDENPSPTHSISTAPMMYLAREIEREYSTDLRRSVLDVLLDIFELNDDAAVRDEVVGHLDSMMLHLLTGLQFGNVTHLLRESGVVLERAANVPDGIRARIVALSDRVSDPDLLGPLLAAVNDAEVPPEQEEFADFVRRLRPRALGVLFIWSAQAKSADVRKILADAADVIAESNPEELIKLISAPDSLVAAEAVKRAAASRSEAAVPALAKVLTLPDEELRIAAVTSLVEIGTQRALFALERALDDANRGIRLAAVKAFTAAPYKGALMRVTELVNAREIRDADRTERLAIFELYGTICGDAGVPALDAMLNGPQGFFKRKSDPDVRSCAAAALARIGTAEARTTLERCKEEKDPLVRRAVIRALGGAS
jgi:HEAT repeat protein